MTLIEEILSKRTLTLFIGVENHSTPYKPSLFDSIFNIPESLPDKNLLIVPVKKLEKPHILSNEKVNCFGKSLRLLFVESPFLTHNAILFDSFPQTDENNYFTKDSIQFLQKSNCGSVAVCDMGVYKSRSLVNLLNYAISSLGIYNISVCLTTILGYNSRGYTDIEIGEESSIYKKEFYLQSDSEISVMNDKFHFVQINIKFKFSELCQICSLTKNPAESILQGIKLKAMEYYKSLKPLWDIGALKLIIKSFGKGESFDFKSLEDKLSEWKFKGDLIDSKWPLIYENLCKKINQANQSDRDYYVQELICAIGNNINSTISFLKLI